MAERGRASGGDGMTSEATTDSQGRLPAGDFDSRAGHPVPFSTPGRWTISTLNGLEVSGYLPDWAEDDPSEAHVLPSQLPLRLAQVEHRTFFEGQTVNLAKTPQGNIAEEEVVFGGSIDCTPFAADPLSRLPVANIQVCPTCWIVGLDPDGIADIAAKLRAQADHLEHEVRPALTAAREDWEARHPGREPAACSTEQGESDA